MFRPLNLLLIFALLYCFDLASLNKYLAHPEYLNYYPGFRYWFLTEILHGHFPQWNPYWGLGHSTEIASTFPIDIFSPLEIFFGPRYHLFQPVQCLALLACALYAFKSFGVPPFLAALGAVFFFLSPWVNYFFFYYLKPPAFITLLLATSFAYQWLNTHKPSKLYKFTLVLILGFFGMKLEYLFFLTTFLSLFTFIFFLVNRRSGDLLSLKSVGTVYVAILFALICHAWQFVPLLQILHEAKRLENPQGLVALASLEIYGKFLLSAKIFLQDFFSMTGWKQLFGPFGAGALSSLCILILRLRLKTKDWLLRLFFFIPIAYYLCRGEPGDVRELTVLHSAPQLLTFLLGSLYLLAAHSVVESKLARVFFATLLCLYVVRDQGQILMSYTTGALWIPTRDNFLFDFLLVSMGVLGISSLQLKQLALKSTLITCLLLLSISGNFYYVHPLIKSNDGKFPEYQGRKSYNALYQQFTDIPYSRAYLFDLKASLDLPFFATSLWQKQSSVQLMSSLGSKRYRDWILFQRYGINPNANWAGYENEYTQKTISKLPLRNSYGFENTVIYWNTLHAFPPPNPNTLRILGVTHLYYEGTRLKLPGLFDYKSVNTFETAKIERSLPRAFSVVLNKNLESPFSVEMNPIIHANTIELSGFHLPYEKISISSYQDERISINTDFTEERHLILSELYHPFWHAKVDGITTEILPALFLYRGLRIPKGKHEVVYYCSIPYLKLGFTLSILLIFLFLLIPLYLSWRSKDSYLIKINQTKLRTAFRNLRENSFG